MTMESQSLTSSNSKRTAGAGAALSGSLRFVGKLILIALFVAMGFFIGGFFQFSNTVTGYAVPQLDKQNRGIVVLTGGSARIAKSLELLDAGKGDRLLISGVNPGTTLSTLRNLNPDHLDKFDCCVDIETAALNTIGNAVETKKWLSRNNYKKIILVTSSYHMPRSMVEFKREMPDVEFIEYPVKLEALSQDGWWRNREMLRFMMAEYLKYVGAWSRPYLQPNTLNALRGSVLGA